MSYINYKVVFMFVTRIRWICYMHFYQLHKTPNVSITMLLDVSELQEMKGELLLLAITFRQ
jgi:hypothetical protein